MLPFRKLKKNLLRKFFFFFRILIPHNLRKIFILNKKGLINYRLEWYIILFSKLNKILPKLYIIIEKKYKLFFEYSSKKMINAFEKRAKQLYEKKKNH